MHVSPAALLVPKKNANDFSHPTEESLNGEACSSPGPIPLLPALLPHVGHVRFRLLHHPLALLLRAILLFSNTLTFLLRLNKYKKKSRAETKKAMCTAIDVYHPQQSAAITLSPTSCSIITRDVAGSLCNKKNKKKHDRHKVPSVSVATYNACLWSMYHYGRHSTVFFISIKKIE